METDKAVVEVPSPRGGVIAELHGKEGEILKVGNVLVSYVADGGKANKSEPAKAAKGAKPSEKTNGSHGSHHAPAAASRGNVFDHVPEPAERTEDAGTVVGSVGGGMAGMTREGGKALATPAVRRLARDMGVDIETIQGTGIGGRVLEKDVLGTSAPRADAKPAPAPTRTPQPGSRPAAPAASLLEAAPVRSAPAPAARANAAPAGDEVTRIPFRGVRRTIANRLRESLNQAVHFTVMDEADVSGLDSLRRKLAAASGEKVSFLPFVCGAVARVLGQSQFRALNATVEETPGDSGAEACIVQHRSVHLGIATDTDSGLMVPVIRDADRMGVLEVGRAVEQIAASARGRSIPREQLMGSTFTISNVGSYAGRFATPVINYPEVGILAVGRAREGVVVSKGAMRVGLLMPLSLACDHRVVDGATAALALAEIVRLLQEPEGLMTPAR
jgi:pyruvate dehydrogenase E2 component (dihydrolipoamide acetyltransferase)